MHDELQVELQPTCPNNGGLSQNCELLHLNMPSMKFICKWIRCGSQPVTGRASHSASPKHCSTTQHILTRVSLSKGPVAKVKPNLLATMNCEVECLNTRSCLAQLSNHGKKQTGKQASKLNKQAKQTNKQANKQTNNQTSKQANKQSNNQTKKQRTQQCYKQTTQQASKPKTTSKQTNKQTKQTNNQTNKQPTKQPTKQTEQTTKPNKQCKQHKQIGHNTARRYS